MKSIVPKVMTGVAILVFGLLACTNPPPPPPINQNPVAAFTTAAPTIKAGEALLFTSSSSDPDGDVLTQSWDFGDDTRGGGSSIAHVFASAGDFTVKLLVADGKGGSSSTTQSITVTAGEPVGPALEVSGDITNTSGLPLAGVTVKLGSSTLGTSDANGKVMVSIPTGASQTLMLFKEGYTDQVAALEFPIGSSAGNAFFKMSMLTQAPSQPLSATTGGAISGEDNAKLEIPANGLETQNGTLVTGNVEVSITPLDVSDPAVMDAMPGRLEGTQTDGSSVGIVSLGMTDFSLTQNGQDLNLKPDSSAKVRIPLYADTDAQGNLLVLGDTIPLWSLSEKTGEWVQEGIGTVVDTGNGTKALEATVTHFSLWNADHIYDENFDNPKPNPPLPPLPKPKPKCKVPPEYDTPAKRAVYCRYLAEMVEIFSEENLNLEGRSVARPQATAPRQPAWRREGSILIENNTLSAPVPPNRDIRFTACVVLENEELCGSQVRKLQRGETPELELLMLPVQKENVVVPLDTTRNFADKRRELSFEVAFANELNFRLERINGSTLNAQVELYQQAVNNSLGGRIFSGELGQTSINAARSLPIGKYVLIVTPSAGSTGDVRIQVENSITEALTLPFDGVRNIPKKLRYGFDFNNIPSSLSLLFERGVGSSLNATIKLINPNNAEIPIGDVGTSPLGVDKILQIAGRYILEVTPNNSTGDLRIKLAPTANLESLTLPFDAVRSIPAIQRYDFDSATSPNGVSVLVERDAGSNLTGIVNLFNPSGALVATGAIGVTAVSFDAQLLVATGKYTLEVKPDIGSSGNARIKIVRKDLANTIAFNTDVNGSLLGRQVHTYTFQGTAGQQISLSRASPLGQTVATLGWNFPGNETLWNGIVTLAQTGTHTVTMTNNSDTPTTYRLRINTIQAPITLNTVDPVTEITTSLGLGEVRRYVFNPPLVLGEVIAFKIETTTNQTSATGFLDGPGVAGNVIGLPNIPAPKSLLGDVLFIPITAPYGLYLYDNSDYLERRGGEFKLSIFRPSAQTLALDSSVSSSIAPNTLKTHRVNVPVNGSYLLRASIATGNLVTAEIWNSDVPRIVGNVNTGDKSEFAAALKAGSEEITGGLKAGNHTISLHNRLLNVFNPVITPTNYSVSLVTLENPTDVVLGAPAVNGLIDVAGERDYYRFNATVGQTFTITATSPAFAGTIRVHKLSTTLDFSSADGGGYIFGWFTSGGIKPLGTHTFTIPNTVNGGTGTYIIEIDATAAQTGAYSVALTSP